MALESKLDKIITKYSMLGEKMMNPSSMNSQEYAKVAKEHSDMHEIVELAKSYKIAVKNLEESEAILKEPGIDDELKEVALEEVALVKKSLEQLNHQIKIQLLPKDEADAKNAILEIRAGTGGDEAALFAA